MNIHAYEEAIRGFDEDFENIRAWTMATRGQKSEFIDSNRRVHESLLSARESFQKTLDGFRQHFCLECGVVHSRSCILEYCDPCEAKLEAEHGKPGIS